MVKTLKKSFQATIFGIGLMLSPFTWWNDAFINAPITVFIGEILVHLFGMDRIIAYTSAYILSNVVGVLMMAFTASDRLRSLVKRYLPKNITT